MSTAYLRIFTLLLMSHLYSQMCVANEYADVGLPMTQIYDLNDHGNEQSLWLTQSNNGLIYVGSGKGLSEWDGEQWRSYPLLNGKRSIRGISQWHDNRLYVGMQNDIGYYQANAQGILTYYSLLHNWSFEQRQFGRIWSVASNKHGVMFAADNHLLFWDGQQVRLIDETHSGIVRIFALADSFIYKPTSSTSLYEVQFEENPNQIKPIIVKTDLTMPEETLVRNIFVNAQQKLVVFTATHGIYQFNGNNLEQQTSRQLLGDETNIYNAIQASDGYYYAVTLNHGLFILDEKLQPLRQYTEEHNLGASQLYHVMEDHQGNIWLSGRLNVIKMLPPHKFSTFQTDSRMTGAGYIDLLREKVTIAGDNLLQLATSDLPLGSPYFKTIKSTDGFSMHFHEYKHHLLYSANQRALVAPITSKRTGEVNTELAHAEFLIDKGRVFATDPNTDALLTATYSGLYHIDYSEQKPHWRSRFIADTQDELDYLLVDDGGIVWAGTKTQELYRIEGAQYLDKTQSVQKFIGEDGLGLGPVIPFKLSSGVVFGTSNGLMDYQPNRQPALDFVKGMPSVFSGKGQAVSMLYEDSVGRIWYQIGKHAGYAIKNAQGQWQVREGIVGFFPKIGMTDLGVVSTSANIIWLAFSSGAIFRLNVNALDRLPKEGKLNIRQVNQLHDGNILYGGLPLYGLQSAVLPQLDQQSNAIRIGYALADNTVEGVTQYRHRLLGSDNNKWSDWSSEHYRDFTELRGAQYQFQLEAKDGWGRIQSVSLPFTVLPPWYLSNTAWFIYMVLGVLLVSISSWLTQRWRTAKLIQQNIELEQKVATRTQEVQDKATQLQQQQTLKDRFFANVSHEFRTPLTLIIEPLKDLLRTHPELTPEMVFPIELALRNSNKMLSLIGQILDINRLESGSFPLRISEYDLANLINQVVAQYSHWARRHQQSIKVVGTAEPVMLYYDQDQIEKCMSNLLSNAIKYAGDNCQIEVSLLVSRREGYLGVAVKDSGPGIGKDQQEKVFERFYQTEQSERISEPGTGIGLALVKELMELHHGEVELVSRLGEGCQFILWLKYGSEHFDASQFIDADSSINCESRNQELSSNLRKEILNTAEDVATILVVDDHKELRQFVSAKLKGAGYRVIQATNGKEGGSLAKSNLPDLIIADVMMPLMDGHNMTQSIKSHQATSTIPIILLTAKSTKREVVEGFQAGADDYLSKPFDTPELIVRVASLINAQKTLRKKVVKEVLSQQASQVGKTKPSYKEKLQAEIRQNLSNPDFDIDALCDSIGMSRSSLNRKCQQTFNMSIGQYITDMRMQTALTLLNEGKYTISEIAYGCGYESLAYFSRVFKKHFGQSPSEFNKLY